jgi:hypothetical protein
MACSFRRPGACIGKRKEPGKAFSREDAKGAKLNRFFGKTAHHPIGGGLPVPVPLYFSAFFAASREQLFFNWPLPV